MLPVHFTQEALYDIEDILVWYEQQREGLSFDFELCLEAGIEEIVRNPKAFQKRYKNIKILFIKRFPYGIHYIIRPNEIIVLGIFHTSRAPKNWAKRL